MPAEFQFWDTSAVVALLVQERHTSLSLKAIDEGRRFWAWNWMQMESLSALVRRGISPENIKRLKALWPRFEYISLDVPDYRALEKVLHKHRLRSADAGHFYCLKQVKRLHPKITFVCFDDELNKAAQADGIRIFS